MRDAIVIPGWNWSAYNAPERVALALARQGSKVLYCDNPTSFFRDREPVQVKEAAPNIYMVRLRHFGHRLRHIPPLHKLQAKAMANKVGRLASGLGLRDPLFIFSNLGGQMDFIREMKKRYFSVLLRIDYFEAGCGNHEEEISELCAELADTILAIPPTIYHRLKAKFGDKVKLIPQAVDLELLRPDAPVARHVAAAIRTIPRPRLGYLGVPGNRLNAPLLRRLLRAHPEWHMVSIGSSPVDLPNAHTLPRVDPQQMAGYLYEIDLGFLPYDLYREQWLHCVPLKLFEYFAVGMPVVSVPAINLWEYEDLTYFGGTAEELEAAIQAGLNEPPVSPKRLKRMEVARAHSVENLAHVLRQVLPLGGHTDNFVSPRVAP